MKNLITKFWTHHSLFTPNLSSGVLEWRRWWLEFQAREQKWNIESTDGLIGHQRTGDGLQQKKKKKCNSFESKARYREWLQRWQHFRKWHRHAHTLEKSVQWFWGRLEKWLNQAKVWTRVTLQQELIKEVRPNFCAKINESDTEAGYTIGISSPTWSLLQCNCRRKAS